MRYQYKTATRQKYKTTKYKTRQDKKRQDKSTKIQKDK